MAEVFPSERWRFLVVNNHIASKLSKPSLRYKRNSNQELKQE